MGDRGGGGRVRDIDKRGRETEESKGEGEKSKSSNRDKPMRPPGTAYCRSLCSAKRETILDLSGRQVSVPVTERVTSSSG